MALGSQCRRDVIAREQPQRTVYVDPFALDVNEVTNEAFARLMPDREMLIMFVLPVKMRWLAVPILSASSPGMRDLLHTTSWSRLSVAQLPPRSQ